MIIKKINFHSTLLLFLPLYLFTSYSQASASNENVKTDYIGVFAVSETFTDMLPIKQIIDDEWVEQPSKHASTAFSQHEAGIQGEWNNLTFSVSKRYDYFVHSNKDTALAYYQDQSNQGVTPNKEHSINLHLFHQEAKGLRLGYNFTFKKVDANISLGYWQVAEIRSSKINGILTSDVDSNITGQATLEEYYSHKNFLKRRNNESWDTEGYGMSVDLDFTWSINEKLTLRGQLKDIYNDFVLKNSGYSIGDFDTSGRFINSIGGVGYLPIYSGKETTQDHHLTLPERINLTGVYHDELMNYIVKLKRQGDVQFYYAGIESNDGSMQLLLDIENMAPEFSYQSQWVTFILGLDSSSSKNAQKLNLGLALQIPF